MFSTSGSWDSTEGISVFTTPFFMVNRRPFAVNLLEKSVDVIVTAALLPSFSVRLTSESYNKVNYTKFLSISELC